MDLQNTTVVVMPLCMANSVEQYLIYLDSIISDMTFQESTFVSILNILECSKLVRPIGSWIHKQNYKYTCQFSLMTPLVGAVFAFAALAVVYKLDFHVKLVADLFVPSHSQKRYAETSEEQQPTPISSQPEESADGSNTPNSPTEDTPNSDLPDVSATPTSQVRQVPQVQSNKQKKNKKKK